MEVLQLIVEANIDDEQERKIAKLCRVKYRLPSIGLYVVEIPASQINHLKGVEGVRAIHTNTHITAQMNTARQTINAAAAEEAGTTGHGVTIAILDTGIAPCDDFIMPQNRLLAFVDFVNNRNHPYDDNAHGTHVP